MNEFTVDNVARPMQSQWRKAGVLWSFVQPHRRALAVGLGLGLGSSLLVLVVPVAAKLVLDGLSAGAGVGPDIAILVGALLTGAMLNLAQGVVLGKLGEVVVLQARTSIVGGLLRGRITALSAHTTGELVSRVTNDSGMLSRAAARSIVELVNALVMILGAVVIMWMLAPVLMITTVLSVFGFTIGVFLLVPGLTRANERSQAAIGRLGGGLESALRAIRTVKASRAEHREGERILADARESQRQSVRAVWIESLMITMSSIGTQVALMLILGIGAWEVATGGLVVTTMVAFLLYALQLTEPIIAATRGLADLQSGIAAAVRIRDIQLIAAEDDAPAGEVVPAAADPVVLRMRAVGVRYAADAAPVLHDIDIDIPRIGHTAIVGLSGSGKTTLFSLMLRLIEPSTGRVSLDGVPVGEWPLAELRERIVYVEQDTPLVPGTLRDNLAYTRQSVAEDEMWSALRAVRLDERASSLPDGLDTRLSMTTMSGGERQRIALARALLARPEVLLLDEATAQLDGIAEAAVHDCINMISKTGAVVTIAHRLSTVIDADRILVLEAGRVRASGNHYQLLETDTLYRDLVAALRIGTAAQQRETRA